MVRAWGALAGPGAFRLFLAFVVVGHHLSRLSVGRAAVYVFFALSGYWLSEMWTAKYGGRYRVYLISRAWRLLPVFLVCSALAWAVAWRSPVSHPVGFHDIISNIAILGYSSLTFLPNGPAWSLDIEMQFYIAAPLLIMALQRTLWALAACVLLSIAAWKADLTDTVFPYLIFFSAGTAASRMRWRPIAAGWIAVGVVIAIAGLAVSPWQDMVLGGAHPRPEFAYNPLINVLIAICIIPLAMRSTTQTGSRYDSMFGDLSYAVYLTHWPIIHLIDTSQGSLLRRAGAMLLATCAFTIVSWIIWRFIDRPSNRARARWVKSQLRQNAVPTNETATSSPVVSTSGNLN